MQRGLVGSEMCIRDRYQRRVHGWVESLYLITITSRGEDFFTRLADELSDALNTCTLIMQYHQLEEQFYLMAFSENSVGLSESIDPCAGWPTQQMIVEKKTNNHFFRCLSEVSFSRMFDNV
eukprot:TRINITY_DN36221_c0_g1_i2.p2 TRINITY_DN36221_c0_g1~~TRINITY_DN36221_c0_g1_i2.p2  ORF type:complete len:121 (+),score=31.68 TRINITY_DN36221_c0_g1_i2:146-508(+)